MDRQTQKMIFKSGKLRADIQKVQADTAMLVQVLKYFHPYW